MSFIFSIMKNESEDLNLNIFLQLIVKFDFFNFEQNYFLFCFENINKMIYFPLPTLGLRQKNLSKQKSMSSDISPYNNLKVFSKLKFESVDFIKEKET